MCEFMSEPKYFQEPDAEDQQKIAEMAEKIIKVSRKIWDEFVPWKCDENFMMMNFKNFKNKQASNLFVNFNPENQKCKF